MQLCPMPIISEPSKSVVSRIPRCLKDLRDAYKDNTDLSIGILAYTLLRCEGALRNMCFIDNEHGQSKRDQIDVISFRCVNIVNIALAARNRHLRVFSIKPWPKRHHHIEVEWGVIAHVDAYGVGVSMVTLPPLIANLYIPSKRVQEDEEDGEERVGPRRGEKLKRPKHADSKKKKSKQQYDTERDLDATDSGGDLEFSQNNKRRYELTSA